MTRETPGLPVGLSIGSAQFEADDEQPLDLVTRADEAMYRHKRALISGPGLRRTRVLAGRS